MIMKTGQKHQKGDDPYLLCVFACSAKKIGLINQFDELTKGLALALP